MNINQIRYFVSAFEQSSFSLAAKQQSVTVQAVSKAINDLEREVGVALFVRANRSVSATPAGHEFYKKARVALKAFRELEAFPNSIDDEAAQPQFKVALCTPAFQGCDTLIKYLTDLARNRIGVDVQFSIAEPSVANEQVRSGELDALLTIGALDKKGVACVTVGRLPTGVVVSASHPLASKQSISIADLQPYPAAVSPWYDTFNTSILTMYRDARLISNLREVDSLEDSNRLLMEEDGYYFSAVYPVRENAELGVRLLPIDQREGLSVPICIATIEDAKNPQARTIMQYLTKLPALLSGK